MWLGNRNRVILYIREFFFFLLSISLLDYDWAVFTQTCVKQQYMLIGVSTGAPAAFPLQKYQTTIGKSSLYPYDQTLLTIRAGLHSTETWTNYTLVHPSSPPFAWPSESAPPA